MRLNLFKRPLLAILVGIGLLLVAAVAYLVATDGLCTECGRTELTEGKLNQDAVDLVTSFSEFPVLWLGTEFGGYPLTSAVLYNRPPPAPNLHPPDHRLVMVYGSCDRGRQTSCAPPLAIHIWAPDSHYGKYVSPDMYIDETSARRGLPFQGDLHSTRLLTAGIAIEIQSEVGWWDQIIEALQLANAALVGLPDIGPGESLAVLLQE